MKIKTWYKNIVLHRLIGFWVFFLFVLLSFAQKPGKNLLIWKPSGQLSISDFTIVPDSSSKITETNLAITRTGITYTLTRQAGSRRFEAKLYATMHHANSYIKQSVLDAPAASIDYLLQHEWIFHCIVYHLFQTKGYQLFHCKGYHFERW